MSFQQNAFQQNAFQVGAGDAGPVATVRPIIGNSNAPVIVASMLMGAAMLFSPARASGSVGPAQYEWGGHARHVHEQNATRAVFPSVGTPPAVATASLPALIVTRPQDPTQVGPLTFTIQRAGAPPQPAVIIGNARAPQLADLTLQGHVRGAAPTRQGAVPDPVRGSPQADPSQIAPLVTPSQPAAAAPIPNPIAGFTAAAPQADPTQRPAQVWTPEPANQGRVPPQVVGSPQFDPSQVAARVTPSQPAAPVVPNPAAGFTQAAPQNDPTQLAARVWAPATAAQGRAPAQVGARPQADPAQIQPQSFPASFTAPAAPGILPIPLIVAAPQQADLTLQPAFFPSIHDGTVVVPPVTPPTAFPPTVGVQPGWGRESDAEQRPDPLGIVKRDSMDLADLTLGLLTVLDLDETEDG